MSKVERVSMAWGKPRAASRFLSLLVAPIMMGFSLAGCPGPEEEMPPPTASAGEDLVVPWGQVVVLNGECTHDDPSARSQLTYRWDMVDWPVASSLTPGDIEGRDAFDAFFSPDEPGDYVFTFRCAVGPFESSEFISAESMVTATVEEPPPNRPPVVDAGEDLLVEVGDTVSLSAEASDPDGDPLTFSWSMFQQPEESEFSADDLVGSDTPEARFVPDVPGRYRLMVQVDDGRGETADDTLNVDAIEVERLDGEIAVTVVDSETGEPVEGASVSLLGENSAGLSGASDGDGLVVFTNEELAGPVDIKVEGPSETISFDHDGDPETEPLIVPRYKTTFLTGIDRPEATVLLEPVAPSSETSGSGTVRGCVGEGLFDSLPELYPMFSTLEGARVSGQFRIVLVAPVVPRASLVDLEVNNFIIPSPHAGMPIPGNMATDDPFLNDWSGQFGIEPGPCLIGDSSAPFAQFELDAPAGSRVFNVIGGVATLDILSVLNLLMGASGVGSINAEIASVLGAIDFETLFMGFLEVDVPDGGEIDISSLLESPDALSAFQEVSHSSAQQTTEVCDDMGYCQDLHQLRVFPASTIEVVPEPPPSDPRVVESMPATSPFEVFCGEPGALQRCDPPEIVDLDVPSDTGTDVPYGLDMVLMDIPAGHVLASAGGYAVVGFRFSRAPGRESERNVFAVPPLDGPYTGLTYSGVSLAFRRLLPRASDGAYFFQFGKAADSLGRLVPGASANVEPNRPLPLVTADPDGLEVEVLFAVEDPSSETPVVTLSHGMAKGLSEPGAERELPESLPLTLQEPVDLIVVSFSGVDRGVVGHQRLPAIVPKATMFLPGDATEILLPNLSLAFESGDEVRVDVAGYVLRGSFAYQQPHDPSLVQRRSTLSSDAWSFSMP